MKNYIKKGVFLSTIAIFFSGIISCEKDFTDIGTSIIKNNIFNTKDIILEIEITNKPITSVRADGLALKGYLGQYLLGVYNNPDYEKIEASIVTQLAIPKADSLKFVKKDYGSNATIKVTIDTAFIKLPYQFTLIKHTSSGPKYSLDSIIGDKTKEFNITIYQSGTYLNILNPTNPAEFNFYNSDKNYDLISPALSDINIPFKPNKNDTVIYVSRKLNNGNFYTKDTIKFTNKKNSKIPIPFASIPLKKDIIKQLFLDKYTSNEFKSQKEFNNYFRGIVIKASGNNGSLISFDLSNSKYSPSIEIFYTSTVIKAGAVIDTVKRHNSFFFSGIKNSIYKMDDKIYPVNNQIKIQGSAGSEAEIKIFGNDNNNNNIPDQIEELRLKNWLINDASLTFYVDKSVAGNDTLTTPYRLFLYKKNGQKLGQIKDVLTEGPISFGGKVQLSNNKPNKYTFKITDYVSDLLNGDSNYSPTLGLRVFNTTDNPTFKTDTIIRPYNWNPKVVTLLNHLPINGTRRAKLKISYTEKK